VETTLQSGAKRRARTRRGKAVAADAAGKPAKVPATGATKGTTTRGAKTKALAKAPARVDAAAVPAKAAEQNGVKPERRGAYLQSLQRGMAVLDALAHSTRPQTAKQVALTLDLDRTITHRILRTLQLEGMVDAVTGGYQLGGRTLLLGNAYLDHLNIRRLAMPYMLDLRYKGFAGRDWSMALFVPVGAIVTIVDQMLPPNGPLDLVLSVGTRFAINHTATGRCILAYTDAGRVVELIGAARAAELAQRFDEIRAAGGIDFAGEDEPHGRPGLAAMAALIRDRAGVPVAALSVSGLGLAPHLTRDSDVALQLRRTAAQIGAALG